MNEKNCKHVARNKFTKEEDLKLKNIINTMYKDRTRIDWQHISKLMGTRNPRQCKDRWYCYLDDNVNLTPFSPEENYKILWSVYTYGKKWTAISQLFNNRTDVAIKAQYKKLLRRNPTLDIVATFKAQNPVSAINSQRKVQEPDILNQIDPSIFELEEVGSPFM